MDILENIFFIASIIGIIVGVYLLHRVDKHVNGWKTRPTDEEWTNALLLGVTFTLFILACGSCALLFFLLCVL